MKLIIGRRSSMASPFPGMDPYLEGEDWTSFHTYLATEIARQLTPLLRPKYVALPQKRFDVVEDGALTIESLYPDVGVAGVATTAVAASGPAVAAPYLLKTVMEELAPHPWIEIRDRAQRQLVTTIEILSPWNKRGAGRDEYLDKRRKLLRSTSHLVEIDLLRGGRRLPMKESLPPGSYFIFVSRAERRPVVEVWPVAVRDELPTVGVPLLAGDADVPLNLQLAVGNVYDLGGFDLVLDYSRPPAPRFTDEDASWAAERLRAFQGKTR
jgi:hypothetical protein